MKFKVTQKDVDSGRRGNAHYCPIAKAIRRRGHRKIAVVGNGRIARINGKTYRLPASCHVFVRLFDSGSTPQPFTFSVDLRKAETK